MPVLATAAFAVALTAAVSIAQTQPAGAALDAEKLLPAGRTLAFVSVADFAQAESAFRATDLGNIWTQLEPFRMELEKGFEVSLAEAKQQFHQQTGVKFEDALAALRGGMAVAVVDMAIPEAANPAPAFVVAFSKQHKATVEGAVQSFLAQQREQGGGGPQGPPPFTVMEMGNAVLVCTDTGALAGPGTKTLADDATFQSLRTRMIGPGGTPVAVVYGNIESVALRATKKDPKGAENLAKSGLLDAKAIGMSIGFGDGRLRETIAVAAPGERHGFMKMVASGKPLELGSLAANAPADLMSFAAFRLDARATLDEVIAVVRSIEPGAAQEMEQGLAEVEKQLKMKIREDLLAPLGDVTTVETWVPEDGILPESLMIVDAKDPAKIEAALAKLARLGGLTVKTLDRNGKKISYFQAPLGKLGDDPTQQMDPEALGLSMIASAFSGAYAIDGGKLYMSALPQSIEDRLGRTAAAGKLADDPSFKAALAATPQGARLFSWGRTRPIAGLAYHLSLRLLRAFEPAIRRAGVPVDTALLPRPAAIAKPMQPATMSFVSDEGGLTMLSQGGMPVLTSLPIIAAIAIPQFVEQRKQAEEMRARMALQQIYYAEQQYFAENNKFTTSLDTLDKVTGGMLQQQAVQAKGWRFVVSRADATGFMAEAQPREGGKKHLIVDQNGFVRGFGEPDPFAGEGEGQHRGEEMPPGEQPQPPEGGEGAPEEPKAPEGEKEQG